MMCPPPAEAPTPETLARELTRAQRRALWRRQKDLFGGGDTVVGPGMTMKALRQRGIVTGAMPHALLTPVGLQVVAVADLGPKDGDPPVSDQ